MLNDITFPVSVSQKIYFSLTREGYKLVKLGTSQKKCSLTLRSSIPLTIQIVLTVQANAMRPEKGEKKG